MCQCPFRALLYFYGDVGTLWIGGSNVSMPFQGSSLFLPFELLCTIHDTGNVSMPFQGSSLFLRFQREQREVLTILCQCPFRALLYFYIQFMKEHMQQKVLRCQCPFRALLYFYESQASEGHEEMVCVNALSGLFFISTYL